MLAEPPTEGFISHMKRDKGTPYEHVLKDGPGVNISGGLMKQNVAQTFSAHAHFQCAYLSQLGDSFNNNQDSRPTLQVITAKTRFKYALVRPPRASARSGLPTATVSGPNKRHYKGTEDNENGRFDEFSLFTK
jgi:hypothetical protein